jgi:hypothetical protein
MSRFLWLGCAFLSFWSGLLSAIPSPRALGEDAPTAAMGDSATTDLRVARRLLAKDWLKLELIVESFNLLNRDNRRVLAPDNGFQNSGGAFVQYDNSIGIKTFPAQYRTTTNFLQARHAYAARQLQLARKLHILRRKCRSLRPKLHGTPVNRHISLDLTREPCNN